VLEGEDSEVIGDDGVLGEEDDVGVDGDLEDEEEEVGGPAALDNEIKVFDMGPIVIRETATTEINTIDITKDLLLMRIRSLL